LFAGEFSAALAPGDSLTIVASTSAAPSMNGEAALAARHRKMDALLERFSRQHGVAATASPSIQQLGLAADQFIAARRLRVRQRRGPSWPGFPVWRLGTASPWLRFQALPGYRTAVARRNILRTFARFVSQGMLPNNFPRGVKSPVTTPSTQRFGTWRPSESILM